MLLNPLERDPVRTADWIELQALQSDPKEFALEAARSVLDMEGTLGEFEEAQPEEKGTPPHDFSEYLVASAKLEIDRRSHVVGDAYPFEISGGVLRADASERYTPYIFCLLTADREDYRPGDQESAKLFEHLVKEAMVEYIDGEAVRFGTPRDTMPPGIHDAIESLSHLVGDRKLSDGYPVNATDKDLGLDVLAWKKFTDGYPGKVEICVQCATGQKWAGKKFECNLDEWGNILLWPFKPFLSLAIPYVISRSEWERNCMGVILMDRLRIASVLKGVTLPRTSWWDWCQERLAATQAV